jgi:outer membrane immunogenic protein
MKRILLATTAFVALAAGSASAADMAVKARPLPPPPPPCAQFGGFYIGGNVGWGYYNYNYHDKGNLVQTIDDDLPVNARLSDDRWNGGVQGGYNWQSRCTLFGIEADYSWTRLGRSETFSDGDGGTEDSIVLESRLKSFGTVRARTGIIVDNVLVYVTGGLAYARFNRSLTVNEDGPPAVSATFSADRSRWGWTAGVGTEWAMWDNWSLKSEFLYMRFVRDEQTFTGTTVNGINFGVPGRAYQINNQDEAWVTRIGLNYRFGGGFGKSPVVARY